MTDVQQTISPVDGSVYVERDRQRGADVDRPLQRARAAQRDWGQVPIDQRAALCSRFVDAFVANGDEIATELTWQMGRPRGQTPGEVRGFEERARYMIEIAPAALGDIGVGDKPGFDRFIERVPLGVVLVLAPWNYPYLTSVNSVVPAIMAGNAVVLKHSSQTPLCAERFAEAFAAAGLPEGVFQVLHANHGEVARIIGSEYVDFVAFTGSVPGGHAVQAAASRRFIATGLELGGKDPAYVRADADLAFAVENVVDGAFYNSGQSCCGIERIYVHSTLFDDFVEGAVAAVSAYRLGDPVDPETNLGPMVRTAAAEYVRGQIEAAVAAGARTLVDRVGFPADRAGTPYLAPQVLIDVDHGMSVMRDESFGPVVGIMKVADDEQAVRLMNDSVFGLTASIWTRDAEAARALGSRIETGTVFMNRCDYLDPALAWVGVKDSGRGCTLSRVGYESLTRPKSFHLRLSG
jgi:acyl-CoA reductase-like NAD-dependent aldehyde dehydrogenase